jgi:hypothetical protein
MPDYSTNDRVFKRYSTARAASLHQDVWPSVTKLVPALRIGGLTCLASVCYYVLALCRLPVGMFMEERHMGIPRTQKALAPLVGLKLSIARRAADLRNFQFGEIELVDGGTVGQYALHIQCPWRLDGPDGIVTGRGDLWRHISGDYMPDDWEPNIGDNLQGARLGELLQGYDPDTGSFVNTTDKLIVERVKAAAAGDATIHLSGGYRLLLFPSDSVGEHWRLFRPNSDTPHFVVEAHGSYEI